MYNALSNAEIERQHVELLPARTVLSLVGQASSSNTSTSTTSPSATSSTPSATSTPTTTAASTTPAPSSGGPTFNNIFVFLAPNQYDTVTGGAAATSGATGTGAAGTSAAPAATTAR